MTFMPAFAGGMTVVQLPEGGHNARRRGGQRRTGRTQSLQPTTQADRDGDAPVAIRAAASTVYSASYLFFQRAAARKGTHEKAASYHAAYEFGIMMTETGIASAKLMPNVVSEATRFSGSCCVYTGASCGVAGNVVDGRGRRRLQSIPAPPPC